MCRRSPLLVVLGAMVFCWGGILGAADAPQGKRNLYFNSSFELGEAGFGCNKILRPDTNPDLRYDRPRIDTSTFVSGRQSMLIPNQFVEETMFYGREVKWELGQEYTFSVWMKTSVEQLPVHVWLCPKTWGGVHGSFTVGPEWKRYSFTFTAPTDRKAEYCHLSVWFAQKSQTSAIPADLWLDDVQLAPGSEAVPYVPGHRIEVSAKAPKLNYLTDGNAEIEIECQAINHSDEPFSGTLTLAIIDDYTNEEVAAPTVEIHLPPGEVQTLACPLRMARYGSYRVEPRLPDTVDFAGNPGYFAVIGRYERGPLDLDRDFCIGINLGGGEVSDARLRPGMQTLGGDVREEYIRLLAEMGCRIIRDHDTCAKAYSWRVVEPEAGHFDFRLADYATNLYLKYGIQPLPVLEATYPLSNEPHRFRFDWLQEKGGTIPKYLACSHIGAKAAGEIIAGPDDPWRRYVHAMAERYRGRITHYEIFNEPNLYISPENYTAYLKSASEELRAADPQCRIVGFCSTGDLAGEGKSAEYLKPCFDLGGLDFADIVSFHPYDSRQLSSGRPADQMIATYRDLVKSYGRDHQLWNTELYYLTDGKSDDPNVHDAPKRFLIDLGEGVRQSVCVAGYRPIFKTLLLENSFGGTARHGIESLPAPMYVVYNALARLFERSRPVGKIRWPLDTICYVYEREDGPRAAFWTYGTIPGVSVNLPEAPFPVRLLDMFGNPVPFRDHAVPLGNDPYYVVAMAEENGKAATAAEFTEWLGTARMQTPETILASLRQTLADGTGTVACVDLRNCQPHDLAGKLRVGTADAELGPPRDFLVPAFSSVTFPVPFSFTPAGYDKPLVMEVTTGGETTTQKSATRLPYVYEARPGLGEVETCRKKGRGWNQDPQIASTFQAGYDAENLILHIEVKDRTPSGEPGIRDANEQDGIVLFLDTRPDLLAGTLAEAQRYHGKVGRIFVSPYETPARRVTFLAGELAKLDQDHVRCTIDLSPEGYTVNVLIPWEALEISGPLAKRRLGFELAVNDAVGAEPAAFQQTWNSWGAHSRNRLCFGIIRFAE